MCLNTCCPTPFKCRPPESLCNTPPSRIFRPREVKGESVDDLYAALEEAMNSSPHKKREIDARQGTGEDVPWSGPKHP